MATLHVRLCAVGWHVHTFAVEGDTLVIAPRDADSPSEPLKLQLAKCIIEGVCVCVRACVRACVCVCVYRSSCFGPATVIVMTKHWFACVRNPVPVLCLILSSYGRPSVHYYSRRARLLFSSRF